MHSELIQESVLSMVLWNKYSPEDDREEMKNIAIIRLYEIFNDYFRDDQKNLLSINYLSNEVLTRRSIISGLCLFRDREE